MKFKVTAAKYHVLEGLHLADESGQWFETHTKASMLEAGIVHFIYYDGECPYRVACPESFNIGPIINGTNDPVAVALAKRAQAGEFASAQEWLVIPLGD